MATRTEAAATGIRAAGRSAGSCRDRGGRAAGTRAQGEDREEPALPPAARVRVPAAAGIRAQLHAAAARLAAREGFTPLLHRGWLQPAEAGAGATPVLLQGDDADVLALAQLQATELPLLSFSIWRTLSVWRTSSVWRSPAASATAAAAPAAGGDAAEGEAPRAVGMRLPITRLRASVRATSSRVFYLDAPGIGALVRVDFVNRGIAEQLGGL